MQSSIDSTGLVGNSVALGALREEIAYAARCDAKVLITGESGAGKEIVAGLIHAKSSRRAVPLVTVNCAALTETLLESELFGHVRGSFTGAYRDKEGVFERADCGTVFMDEIGETTPRMQGLLLRFLETGELQRVGSDDRVPRRVNVRVIAATNRALLESVAAGTFREDLYYRLNVIHLHVPALRERREDIPELLEFFLASFSKQYAVECPRLCPMAKKALAEYTWPGNVRELRNVVERCVVRGRSRLIEARDLPLDLLRRTTPEPIPVVGGADERATPDALFAAIVNDGQSFWDTAYPCFMSRDLTREDLRALVRKGLARTTGNYRVLTELFNIPPKDYRRFVAFLRKHHCQVAFQEFRTAAPAHADLAHRAPRAAASA